ncbi:MAG: pyridoxamine 5'-phosphate oxidase [Thermosynechococcus sp. Uc]|uniref:pyridoxamine 5'-phosphate oxidase n=1 Tax=Thermosynechococcus sp. Uc TaxID=3034853 RepID=UPI0019EEFF14|nr:pyridoxamine 5'-phosphate oxidase [Thermosynechococcus sp. Uc]MDM7326237.1 pyridoxamine 5'-phosphate oxidase [Thermosynechococcus sp. Uc]HIK25862.1 pyridoxamine 5'-phosphate oxidase [Thermosynechococcus sp. M46_R2017_013]
MTSIADLRRDYRRQRLLESEAAEDPIQQFRLWFTEAVNAELPEPNAMTLATLGLDGMPAARLVLLKEVDERGFVFFTNYRSRKGLELAAHPKAALVFWWAELERQVRIEGHVEQISAAESDAYFQSRPLGNRWGAWASQQSEILESYAELEARLAEVEARYGENVPRPEHWGGYRVLPTLIEFWQGRPNRLHDRLCYRRQGDHWQRVRLYP